MNKVVTYFVSPYGTRVEEDMAGYSPANSLVKRTEGVIFQLDPVTGYPTDKVVLKYEYSYSGDERLALQRLILRLAEDYGMHVVANGSGR